MRIPKRRRHSSRNKDFVEWRGRRHYLPGASGSKEAVDGYRSFLQEHVLRPNDCPAGETVPDLLLAYLQHLRDTRGPDDRELAHAKRVASYVLSVAESKRIGDFGPNLLRTVQRQMVSEGLSRGYINHQVVRIRRIFRWGVSREMVRPEVLVALQSVEPLRSGAAREAAPRTPVSWDAVEATLPHLHPVLQSLTMLIWYTGCRPENACLFRPREIDRSVSPWVWTPTTHKNEHRGQTLEIFVGPRCQETLLRWLDRDPDRYAFSPREVCPGRQVRDHYSPNTYRQALMSAQARAAGVTRKRGQKVTLAMLREAGWEPWTPYQLRHARATVVREQFGLEAAQATLGHATLDATQIYAKRLRSEARRVSCLIG